MTQDEIQIEEFKSLAGKMLASVRRCWYCSACRAVPSVRQTKKTRRMV